MNTEKVYTNAVAFVKCELEKLNYPSNHPFNNYPNTPESMILEPVSYTHLTLPTIRLV